MAEQIQSMNSSVRPPQPGPMRPPVGAAAPTLTPKEIVGILRRHVFMMVFFTISGLVIGTGAWFLLLRYAPKYTARAAIEVLQPAESDPMSFGGVQTNKDLYYEFRLTKSSYIKELSNLQELLQRDKIRSTSWFKQFCQVNDQGEILNISDAITDAVEDLEDHLGAGAGRDQQWITISMTCGSKEESALIVNEMVMLFLDTQRNIATRDIREQLKTRKEQRDSLQSQLTAAEDSLVRIRETAKYSNLTQTNFRDYLTENIARLQLNQTDMQTTMTQLQSTIRILEDRVASPSDPVAREQMERDPIASSTRQRIILLETTLAQQLSRFGETHPRVRQTRDSLKQMKIDLADRQNEIRNIMNQSNLRNTQDQLTTFTQQLDSTMRQLLEAKAEHRDLARIQAEYEKIEKIRDEKRDLYEAMVEHIEKLNMNFNNPEISKLKLAYSAIPPLVASSPKLIVYLPGGFMLGFMLGVGLAFAVELLNDYLRTPKDVMKHLKIRLLGMICHGDEDEGTEGVDFCNVVRQAPFSIMSEEYRQLRTNLKLSGIGKSTKTFLVTSGAAGEGRTSVAANLTFTLIAENKKVLFIDSNFRRPCTAAIFPIAETNAEADGDSDFGLSNYLSGQCGLEDGVIRSSGIEELDIVDSGPLPSNPAEMLGNIRMTQLLDRGRRDYDYVIIDGPPLLVSDAKTVAALVDGIIVVFNASMTRCGTAQRTLRELRSTNANIVGCVLLGVRVLKGGYFHETRRAYEKYQQPALTR